MENKKFVLDGIEFITIRNRNFFEVTLCSLGASIYEISHHFNILTLTPSNIKDFLKPTAYYGRTIGRVAGRIKDGQIVIDNKHYYLAQNEGNNVLHGGYIGLSTCRFNSKIIETPSSTTVEYTYTSYDLESGFPGTIELVVRYIVLDNEDSLKIEYEAYSTKNTVLNLTNHVFFTLNETNNLDLKLTMLTDKYIYPDDKNLLPLEIKDKDERFDFNNGLYIKEHLFDESLTNVRANGYDHMLIKSNEDDHLLTLEGNKYKLEIFSSYLATQLYSDNIIDNVKMKGVTAINHRALAIEPQQVQLGDISLKAYDRYKHYILYKFERR